MFVELDQVRTPSAWAMSTFSQIWNDHRHLANDGDVRKIYLYTVKMIRSIISTHTTNNEPSHHLCTHSKIYIPRLRLGR